MISDEKWKRNIRDTIKRQRPCTTDEEIDLLLSSSFHWGPNNYRSAADWAVVSTRLIDEPELFGKSLSFINLNGLLVDIPIFLTKKIEFLSRLEITSSDSLKKFIVTIADDKMGESLRLQWESHQLASLLRNSVSDDDLFLLGFFRHTYCHPVLDDYAAKIAVKKNSSKINIAKWKRLVDIKAKTKEDEFKVQIIEKLKPNKCYIESLATKLDLISRI